MKQSLIFLFVLLSVSLSSQNAENDILGKWMATDKSVAVQIYKIKNDFKAKVIWFNDNLGSKRPMNIRTDTENPDPKLRSRKILGMEVLNGLKFNAEKRIWESGKIYDASSGRTWDAYSSLEEDGLMKVRGFWKYTWIGKSMHFRRMD